MAGGLTEFKTGFWIGLGVVLAFSVAGLLQFLAARAAEGGHHG